MAKDDFAFAPTYRMVDLQLHGEDGLDVSSVITQAACEQYVYHAELMRS